MLNPYELVIVFVLWSVSLLLWLWLVRRDKRQEDILTRIESGNDHVALVATFLVLMMAIVAVPLPPGSFWHICGVFTWTAIAIPFFKYLFKRLTKRHGAATPFVLAWVASLAWTGAAVSFRLVWLLFLGL